MPENNRKEVPEHLPEGADGSSGRATPMLYAARQPILDGHSKVYGYELLFRSGPENKFTATDIEWASAANLEQGATAFGLDLLVGDRRAFVNLTRGAILAEYHRLIPRERVVLEILEDVAPDADVLAVIRRARAEGYLIALDDYAGEPSRDAFLPHVDIVKADLRRWPEALTWRCAAKLRNQGVRLLAEKVETLEEADKARNVGYELLQGYFFCQPQMMAVRDLPPAKTSILRFMAEMSASEIKHARIEELFRSDVGLTVRLLRYLNSASFGLRQEVQSIGHAINLLGERPLKRWSLMLAMMVLCDDRPQELLVTALSRARFAERMAPSSGLAEHDQELFLAGMLTMVDAMVGRPAEELLAGLAVSDTVRDAVLHRASPLGPVLDLVTAYQTGDWNMVQSTREHVQVDAHALDEAYADSIRWAEAVSA